MSFQAKLNHIGIAVQNLPELKRLFAILGLSVAHSEDVPSQKVETHFLPLPVQLTNLELLIPTDPSGTVGRFLTKRGPGIHHLSFELPKGSLDETSAKLRQAGFKLIYDKAEPGAHNMRVNFIHPVTAGGILIEVMEPAGEH